MNLVKWWFPLCLLIFFFLFLLFLVNLQEVCNKRKLNGSFSSIFIICYFIDIFKYWIHNNYNQITLYFKKKIKKKRKN